MEIKKRFKFDREFWWYVFLFFITSFILFLLYAVLTLPMKVNSDIYFFKNMTLWNRSQQSFKKVNDLSDLNLQVTNFSVQEVYFFYKNSVNYFSKDMFSNSAW